MPAPHPCSFLVVSWHGARLCLESSLCLWWRGNIAAESSYTKLWGLHTQRLSTCLYVCGWDHVPAYLKHVIKDFAELHWCSGVSRIYQTCWGVFNLQLSEWYLQLSSSWTPSFLWAAEQRLRLTHWLLSSSFFGSVGGLVPCWEEPVLLYLKVEGGLIICAPWVADLHTQHPGQRPGQQMSRTNNTCHWIGCTNSSFAVHPLYAFSPLCGGILLRALSIIFLLQWLFWDLQFCWWWV